MYVNKKVLLCFFRFILDFRTDFPLAQDDNTRVSLGIELLGTAFLHGNSSLRRVYEYGFLRARGYGKPSAYFRSFPEDGVL